MIDKAILEQSLGSTLSDVEFPRLGQRIRGKVRDSYVGGGRRTIVVSDRVSAFDVVLGTVPFKGQVLNGIAAFWFERSRDLVPNHLISVPDPQVSVVQECQVFPAEMIVRAYLTGSSPTSIWTHYADGAREYCGHRLPDGLGKHERLPSPLITPTTKAAHGAHDELTTADALIAGGVFSGEQYETVSAMCLELFAFGSKLAAERGLILVDTKYEIGRRADGTIVFVDEVHTPDSSRYWYTDGYEQALRDGGDPRPLDKDFLRRHLVERGFRGEGKAPALSDAIRVEAAQRYIELYEQVTGTSFVPDLEPPAARISRNLALE